MSNRVELTGRILNTDGPRFTPGGIAVAQLRLQHTSEKIEAGRDRQMSFELDVVAFGPVAASLARQAVGRQIRITGFLDRKSPRSSQLALHVTDYVLIEE